MRKILRYMTPMFVSGVVDGAFDGRVRRAGVLSRATPRNGVTVSLPWRKFSAANFPAPYVPDHGFPGKVSIFPGSAGGVVRRSAWSGAGWCVILCLQARAARFVWNQIWRRKHHVRSFRRSVLWHLRRSRLPDRWPEPDLLDPVLV